MNRLTLVLVAIVLGAIFVGSGLAQPVSAQDEATTTSADDVRAQFQGLTIAEAEELGYALLTPCVDASEVPPEALTELGIPASAGQGIHYLNEGLLDTTLTASEPEAIMFGPDGDIWGVEYLTPPQAEPLSVLGQTLEYTPAVDLDTLHLWVIDNPAGQFADFNRNVTCVGSQFLKWDIISLDFSGAPEQLVANPDGSASARSGNAAAGGSITMTGSGTFAAPGAGGSSAVTGGGTWETFDNDGTSTGSGTYDVKSLVSWQAAPGSLLGSIIVDNNGNAADSRAGLVTLAIEYSDGSQGVLTISCRLPTTPADVSASIQEGITATKGFVQYWDRDDPAPGVDANRTVFHVVSGTLPTETLTVPAGGDFVAWVFGDATASQVFQDVNVAWIWQDGGWVAFIPPLGTTDFAIPFASILFVTVDEETEIEVPARE